LKDSVVLCEDGLSFAFETLTCMPHFTKRIETTEGSSVFYFNRIYTVNGTRYHVSVRNNSGIHYFMMEDRNGSWVISNTSTLPNWIMEREKELEKAIIEHLAID